MKNWAVVPLRLGLGVIFIAHGLQKTFAMFGGPGIEGFSKFLSSLGFAPALFWAYVVACVELLGGVGILIGLATRISCSFISIVMLVAVAKVHLAKGFFIGQGGFEFNFLILCACAALLIAGPGKWSLTKKL